MKKLIMIISVAIIVFGCSMEEVEVPLTKTEMLVGKWQLSTINGDHYQGQIFYQYYSNGHFSLTGPNGIFPGTWSWLSSRETDIVYDWDDPNWMNTTTFIESLTTTDLVEIDFGDRIEWVKL